MLIKIIKKIDIILDKMKLFNKIRLNFFINFHNYSYTRISYLSKGFNNGLHPKHAIIRYYQFFINNIEKDSIVLDIGCGRGHLTSKISEKAKKVIAVDINKNYIEQAKKKYNRNNITFIIVDATKYDFKEKFDYIILSNVLEHIEDRYNFLIKIKSLANNFLIRVPMINRSWLPIYKKNLGFEYRLDKTHYIEYTFESFKNEIKSAGLEISSFEIKFGEIWAKIESFN